MTDYIRKAVELADGFSRFCGLFQIGVDYNEAETDDDNPYQWFLDALAAQLVRQVDALRCEQGGPDIDVLIGKSRSAVRVDTIATVVDTGWQSSGAGILTFSDGPDRTMSTIKAIVDSKVLE